MKRQPVKHCRASRYPSIRFARSGRARLLGLGVIAITLGPACGGDQATVGADTSHELAGDMEAPQEEVLVTLPETGSHNLSFDEPWGWVDYHVVVVANVEVLAVWLESDPEALLARLDAVLAAHDVTELKPGEDYSALEAELLQAIKQAIDDGAGISSDHLLRLELFVDAYTDENDIDGDMGKSI